MKIAIFGAMPQELDLYYSLNRFNSSWKKHDVIINHVGVGKTSTAMNTQKTIDFYKPDFLLLTGVAASLHSGLGLGSVGLISSAVDSELDVRSWNKSYSLGEQPITRNRLYHSNPDLMFLASRAPNAYAMAFCSAYVASGSVFLDAAAKRDFIKNVVPYLKESALHFSNMTPNLYDMETSAFLQVANANDVPALAIRTVSDTLNGDAPKEFNEFIDGAVSYYSSIVTFMFEKLPVVSKDLGKDIYDQKLPEILR